MGLLKTELNGVTEDHHRSSPELNGGEKPTEELAWKQYQRRTEYCGDLNSPEQCSEQNVSSAKQKLCCRSLRTETSCRRDSPEQEKTENRNELPNQYGRLSPEIGKPENIHTHKSFFDLKNIM